MSLTIWDKLLNFLAPYKVALQISGLPRTWEADFSYFKEHIIEPLKPDVYIHTWIDGDNTREANDFGKLYNWNKQGRVTKEILRMSGFPMISQMKAMKMVAHDIKAENVIPMLYSRWHCNELRKGNEKKYDVVILARTEITMTRALTRKELDLAKHKALIPRGFNAGDGYNDLFAVCSPEVADLYTGIYKNLNKMVFDDYIPLNPHNILKRTLVNVPVERVDYPIYLRKEATWNR